LQTVAATAKDRARLTGGTYGIELATRAVSLTWRGSASTVFFNRELELPLGAARLAERPWIVGLVARWRRRHRLATIRHVILATPGRGGVRLEVMRADGERVATGRVAAQDGSVRFSVVDITGPIAARTRMCGSLSARRVELDRAADGDTPAGRPA
jgi:hypothetical protein